MRGAVLVAVACILWFPLLVGAQASNTASGQRTIGGTGLDRVPEAATGKVEVVSFGRLESQRIPVVVRNGTSDSVADLLIRVEARDSEKLLGTAESFFGDILPIVIPPQGVAVGYIFMDGDIPASASLTFTVTFDAAPGQRGRDFVDLQVGEINGFDDRIVGEMVNPSSKIIDGASFMAVCLDADGTPTGIHTTGSQSPTDPGSTIPFQIGLGSETGQCDYFLVAGYARV